MPFDVTQMRTRLNAYMEEIRDLATSKEDVARYAQFNAALHEINEQTDVISNCSSDDLIYFDGSLSECSFQVVGADIVVTGVRSFNGNYQGTTLIIQGGANQQLNFFTQDNQHDFEQVIENYKEMFTDYAESLEDDVSTDDVSTSAGDNSIAISFDTGDITRVVTYDDVSPTFNFSSGDSRVYNRTTDFWQPS